MCLKHKCGLSRSSTLQYSAARPAASSSVSRAQGHAHDVAAAAFSPDGATIATGADDNKVRPCAHETVEEAIEESGCQDSHKVGCKAR